MLAVVIAKQSSEKRWQEIKKKLPSNLSSKMISETEN
jgi:hypothetical protein